MALKRSPGVLSASARIMPSVTPTATFDTVQQIVMNSVQ